MVPGMLYIIMDFAMNYSHNHLEETQSELSAKNQTTMLPVPPVKGARRLARGRPGEGSQLLVFPVFHAEEVKAENEWHFQSALICYREGGSTLGRGWWRMS